MADIAEIGFKADTSGLDRAKSSLEAMSPAADKAEKASEKLQSTLDQLGKTASQLQAAATSVAKASDKLAASLGKNSEEAGAAQTATTKLNSAMDASAAAAKKAETASASLAKQISQTAAASDASASKAMRSLQDEAKARLDAEKAAGKTYSSGLDPNRASKKPAYTAEEIKKAREDFAASAAKATPANDKLNKSLNESTAASGNASGGFSTLTAVLARLAVAFVATFSANKIIGWLTEANAATIALGETAKRTGIDLQRLQALQFAGVANGMTRTQVSTGLEGLTEKLNDSRQTETTLSKLFDENNIKLKTRTGEVISTNDALLKASGLIQNAATEFDKIKIAEALGLTRDWIPLLEQGPDALNKIANAAEGAGGVIDSGMVQRAKDFQRDWAVAIDRWVTMFQAAAGPIIAIIDRIIAGIGASLSAIGNYSRQVQANEDIKTNGAAGMNKQSVDYLREEAARTNQELTGEAKARGEAVDEMERENNRYARAASGPLNVTVNKPAGGFTKTKSLFPDKGGGGGGNTDEDNFDTIVTRANVRLQKLKAEQEALGLTAEAAAKLKFETDLLGQAQKAGIDLTDAQRNQLVNLASQMASTETETKNLKSALDFGKDITKGFLTDFVNGIKNGESAFQSLGKAALNVLNKIGDKLISMAVDSLFTKGSTSGGGIGGIFSGIMKFFTGGSALGDAFTGSGKMSRFAKGGSFTNGIYSKPTQFSYAGGAAFGEMGEAGPEAVMPLQRGPDGSLGVQMYGKAATRAPVNNDVTVTNVYQISGAVSSEEITAQIRATAENTLETTKKSLSGWLGQISADGAVV